MTIPNAAGTRKEVGRIGEEERPQEADSRLQRLLGRLSDDWLLWACILLSGTLCFGLGLIIARENQKPEDGLWIEQLPANVLPGSVATSTARELPQVSAERAAEPALPAQPAAAAAHAGTYVASKTGSKYYLPNCGSAKRIKEENRVWFATRSEAEAAGYAPAANCKGL